MGFRTVFWYSSSQRWECYDVWFGEAEASEKEEEETIELLSNRMKLVIFTSVCFVVVTSVVCAGFCLFIGLLCASVGEFYLAMLLGGATFVTFLPVPFLIRECVRSVK